MSLAGLGVVAAWHDVAEAARDDFQEWHTREHLPSRVGTPGVRRGRRYVAIAGAPEFFSLIEADSVEVLTGQDYRQRLAAATPWARRVAPAVRDVVQVVARVPFTNGVGSGGVLLTLRFAIDAAQRDGTLDALRRRVLPPLVYRKGVTGIHLCIADEDAGIAAPPWVMLVEGVSVPDVEGAADDLAPALQAHAAHDLARNVYRLAFTRLTTPWAAG